jgi:hypothetical protein
LRPRRTQGKPEKRKRPKQPGEPQRFKEHPLFGRVPLFRQSLEHNGKLHVYYSYSLAYEPELPKGAVRGDPRKQNLCFHCHTPRYFYVNEGKTCVQCGEDFLFSAAEQKFWYENLGFYGTSVPIRCPNCRRQQRSASVLSSEIGQAKKALKRAPNDPSELLFLAESIVRYHQKTGQGKLSEAISAARRAHRIDSRAHEALFWEGACHLGEQRTEKGLELIRRFAKQEMRSKKQHDLFREAKKILAETGS